MWWMSNSDAYVVFTSYFSFFVLLLGFRGDILVYVDIVVVEVFVGL